MICWLQAFSLLEGESLGTTAVDSSGQKKFYEEGVEEHFHFSAKWQDAPFSAAAPD